MLNRARLFPQLLGKLWIVESGFHSDECQLSEDFGVVEGVDWVAAFKRAEGRFEPDRSRVVVHDGAALRHVALCRFLLWCRDEGLTGSWLYGGCHVWFPFHS